MALEKIVITDCDHANIDEETKVFNEANVSFALHQCKTEQDLIDQCKGAVAAVNQYAPFTEKVFAALPDLKVVVRYGVGVDNVDLEAATKHGVQVCNVPDYGTFDVADHATSLMLELCRKVGYADSLVKSGVWDYAKVAPIRRLSTYTVGIIGLGRIGLAFAKRAHAFGCPVIGYDICTKKALSTPEYSFIKVVSKEELFAQADIISLHCNLTHDNDKFMNKEAFAQMKKGAIFLNVSRGGLVNEDDLADSLISGHLGAAGIDVTCHEPLENESKLRKAPNIVITPHMAWYSVEAASDLKTKSAEEAVRAVKGEKLRCPVNQL